MDMRPCPLIDPNYRICSADPPCPNGCDEEAACHAESAEKKLKILTDQDMRDEFEAFKVMPSYLVYRILVAKSFIRVFEQSGIDTLIQMWRNRLDEMEPFMTDEVRKSVNQYQNAFWNDFQSDGIVGVSYKWPSIIRVDGMKSSIEA